MSHRIEGARAGEEEAGEGGGAGEKKKSSHPFLVCDLFLRIQFSEEMPFE